MNQALIPTGRLLHALTALPITLASFNSFALDVYLGGKGGAATIELEQGIYEAKAISGGWNAWGQPAGTPVPDGVAGWLNGFEGGSQFGTFGVGTAGRYASASEAIAAAPVGKFVLPNKTKVTLRINDPGGSADNTGGLRISIVKVDDAKPWAAEARRAADILGHVGSFVGAAGVYAWLAAGPAGAAGAAIAAMTVFTASELSGLAGAPANALSLGTGFRDLALGFLPGGVPGAPAGYGLGSLGIGAASMALEYYAKDPPDMNYQEIPHLSPIAVEGSPTQQFASNATKLADALIVSINAVERFQGASLASEVGTAGAAASIELQRKAYFEASGVATESAAALARLGGLLGSSLSSVSLPSRNDLLKALEELKHMGAESFIFSPQIVATLENIGISKESFLALAIEGFLEFDQSLRDGSIGFTDMEFFGLQAAKSTTGFTQLTMPSLVSAVPEPKTFLLLMLGISFLCGLHAWGRQSGRSYRGGKSGPQSAWKRLR